MYLRGQSDKYLASWPDGASIAREKYYHVVHSLRRLLSKLAPCDFFMFPNLKKLLTGQKFESSDEVIAAKETYFADLEKTYFLDRLKKSNSAEILTIAV